VAIITIPAFIWRDWGRERRCCQVISFPRRH